MASSQNQAEVKFTADTKDFQQAIKSANSTLTELRSELKLNKTEAQSAGDSIENLADRQRILAQEIETQQSKIGTLNQRLEQAKAAFGETSPEVQKLQTQLNNAATAQNKMQQELDATNSAMDEMAAASQQAGSAMGKLESEISQQETALSGLKDEYNRIAMEQGEASDEARRLAQQIQQTSTELKQNKSSFEQATSAADKFDATLDSAADSAEDASDSFGVMDAALGDFISDTAQNVISTLADFEESTRESRNETNKMIAVAQQTGQSLDGLTDSYNLLYGITGDSTLSNTAVLNMSAMGISVQDQQRIVNAASGAWAAYGDSIPLDGLLESINETTRAGTVTGSFADALNWAAMSSDQWSAALSGNSAAQEAFNKGIADGMTVEDAFNEALAACSDTGERQKLVTEAMDAAYGELGATYQDVNADVIAANQASNDLSNAQAELGAAIAPVTTAFTELQAGALQWIADNLPTIVPLVAGLATAFAGFAAVQAATTAINNFKNGVGLLSGVMQALTNPVGIVIAAIALLVGAFVSAYNSNEEFRNAVNNAWTQIQAFIGPIIQNIVTIFQTWWPIIQQTVTNVMTAIQNVISVAWPIIQQIFTTAGTVIQTIVQTVWPPISSLIQSVMLNIQNIISVAWPIIQQIFTTGQQVIQTLVQTVWPVIQNVVTTVMNAIQTVVSVVWPVIQAIFQTAMDVIGPLVDGVFNQIQNVITTVLNVVQGIISTVLAAINGDWEGVWNGILSIIGSVWDGIVNTVTNLISTVASVIANVISGIKDNWSNAWNAIKDFLGNAWEGIKNGVSNGIDAVLNFMSNLPGNILSALGNLGSLLLGAGKDLINGLKNGITGAIQGVVDAVKGGVSRVVNAAKGLLGIHSPSTVFAEIGMFTMEGMQIGIDDNVDDVVKQTQAAMDDVVSGASATLESSTLDYALGVNIEANNGLSGLVRAVEDLADRVISIEIDGKQIARTTANAADRVNGSRQQLVRRGVSLA